MFMTQPIVRPNRRDLLKTGVTFGTVVWPLTAQDPWSKSGSASRSARATGRSACAASRMRSPLARQLGLDGVQVSMGSVETICTCAEPRCSAPTATRRAPQRRAHRRGRARRDEPGPVQVGSAHRAMGQRQHRCRPRAGVRVVLLAFFERGIFATTPTDRLKSSAG